MNAWIVVGILLLLTSGGLWFVQRSQVKRLRSLQSARSVTVEELQNLAQEIASEIGGGNWQDYIKLSGFIRCDRPLLSELKQEPCVHYQMSVSREYEETVTKQDSQGKSYRDTQRGSETVSSNKRSTPFYLEDATGRIEVNPNGADIETVKILNEFRSEPAVGGMISFGGFSLALGNDGGRRRTLGYRYSESILPIDQRAVVVGMMSDRNGSLMIQKPTQSQHHFIISLKDEETLARATRSTAQAALYAMIASLGLGSLLIVIGLVT